MLQTSLLDPWPRWLPDLLDALARHRALRLDQVAHCLALAAPALLPDLLRLTAAGILLDVGPALSSSSQPQAAYVLTTAGASLARGLRGEAVQVPHPQRVRAFLDHELALADVALVFDTLRARGVLEVFGFDTDRGRLADATWLLQRGRPLRVPLVADGLAVVRHAGHTQGLLFEIDRGTVSLARMRLKYAGYLSWWREGGPARRFGITSLRVVTVAPQAARLSALRGAALDATDGRGSGLFWFVPQAVFDLESPTRCLGVACTVAQEHPDGLRSLFSMRPSADAAPPEASLS